MTPKENFTDENSWENALDIVRDVARIPTGLPHLMRGCWNGLISPADFVRLMGNPGYSINCLIRAAQIQPRDGGVHTAELHEAVDILGVKASSLMLGINSICEGVLDSGPAARVWAPIFKEMMSEIEIGYHFGSSVEQVGFEQGILVGFSRLAGAALLLTHRPKAFTEWYHSDDARTSPEAAIDAFGCEPYQVSSLLMQHLGLGPEVALATASTLGDIHTTIVEVKPMLETWKATYHWLHALKNGLQQPEDERYHEIFPELQDPASAAHIAMLMEQVANVREKQSEWTWHLPLPTYEETAQAIVYRVNSSARGTTWSKGLVA